MERHQRGGAKEETGGDWDKREQKASSSLRTSEAWGMFQGLPTLNSGEHFSSRLINIHSSNFLARGSVA